MAPGPSSTLHSSSWPYCNIFHPSLKSHPVCLLHMSITVTCFLAAWWGVGWREFKTGLHSQCYQYPIYEWATINRELRSRVSEQQVTKRTPPPLQEWNALDSKHCGPEILRKQSEPYFLFLDCMWKSQLPQSEETISPEGNMKGLKSQAAEKVIDLME